MHKNAQKDKDARWTTKNDASFYGYKNHLGVDKAHKLIRKWDATDAAVHDSQKLDDALDLSNTGKGVGADSAYCSVKIEAGLKDKGLQSRIHRRAARPQYHIHFTPTSASWIEPALDLIDLRPGT